MQKLSNLKVFPKEKLKLLYDPILKVNLINLKKREKIEDRFFHNDYILGIGRLTKQKNFSLLISAFKEIIKNIQTLSYSFWEREMREKNLKS